MTGRFTARISDGNSSTTPLGAAGATEIVFRSVATATVVDPATQITVSKPAGTVQDDVMVAFIQHDSVDAVITPPSGWTTVRQDTRFVSGAASDVNVTAYTKRAGATEPANYTWTFSVAIQNQDGLGAIVTYDNVATVGAPVNAHSGATEEGVLGDDTVTAPSVANTTAGSMLVAYFLALNDTGSFTPPAGMNERADVAGTQDTFSVADQIFGAGGDTGDRTATFSMSLGTETHGAQMLALTPAVAGGGATFFGVAEDVLDYSALRITAEADRFGFLDIEFSTDGVNWRKTDSFPTVRSIFDPAGETSRSEVIPIKGRFARVNFRNRQAAAQTFFRLQTILLPEADQALSRTPERFRVHNGIATVGAGATGTVLTITGENAERAVEVIAYGATQSPGSSIFTFQQVLLRANTAMHRRAVRNQVGDHWVHVRFDTSGNDIKVDVTNDDVVSRSFIAFVQVREF